MTKDILRGSACFLVAVLCSAPGFAAQVKEGVVYHTRFGPPQEALERVDITAQQQRSAQPDTLEAMPVRSREQLDRAVEVERVTPVNDTSVLRKERDERGRPTSLLKSSAPRATSTPRSLRHDKVDNDATSCGKMQGDAKRRC